MGGSVPEGSALEQRQKPRGFRRDYVDLVVRIIAPVVPRVARKLRDLRPKDLRALEFLEVSDRVLDLVPLVRPRLPPRPGTRSRPALRLRLQDLPVPLQVRPNRRV